jgi:hypothetical protein
VHCTAYIGLTLFLMALRFDTGFTAAFPRNAFGFFRRELDTLVRRLRSWQWQLVTQCTTLEQVSQIDEHRPLRRTFYELQIARSQS